jgi:predicted KAP-like P-loop ATPase
MITINKPIKIPDHDIFKNDLLDRKGTIEDLSNLIVSDIQPFVFSVNADWGAGKTTFIKLWQAHLKESYKVKSIYFSAWEDDFTSDPLIAILGELKAYIEENHNELKNNFEDVKKTGGKIIRNSLPLILKGVAGKIIWDETVAKKVNAFLKKSTTALIDKYQKEKKTWIF